MCNVSILKKGHNRRYQRVWDRPPIIFFFQKASDGLGLGCTWVWQWRFDEKKKQVWRVKEEMRKPVQKCNFLGHFFNQGVRRGVLYTPWKPKSSWRWMSSQIQVGGPIWPKIWTKPIMRMWKRWIITKPLWSGAKFRRQKCQSNPNLRGVNTPHRVVWQKSHFLTNVKK